VKEEAWNFYQSVNGEMGYGLNFCIPREIIFSLSNSSSWRSYCTVPDDEFCRRKRLKCFKRLPAKRVMGCLGYREKIEKSLKTRNAVKLSDDEQGICYFGHYKLVHLIDIR